MYTYIHIIYSRQHRCVKILSHWSQKSEMRKPKQNSSRMTQHHRTCSSAFLNSLDGSYNTGKYQAYIIRTIIILVFQVLLFSCFFHEAQMILPRTSCCCCFWGCSEGTVSVSGRSASYIVHLGVPERTYGRTNNRSTACVCVSEWSHREKPFFWAGLFFFFVLTFISQPVTQIWEFRRPLGERFGGGRFAFVLIKLLPCFLCLRSLDCNEDYRILRASRECSNFHEMSQSFVE